MRTEYSAIELKNEKTIIANIYRPPSFNHAAFFTVYTFCCRWNTETQQLAK